jgi:DNA primase
MFRERLIFPIFSATGDVVGFGGRTLQPDGIPKYLNSSESPVFSKGRVLYGLHETGKYIRAEDSAIVVEGYMDAIALYTAGIKNVVAILGTAFTADHAKVLKRYTENVTMLLDGDDAGIGGAERSLPILLSAGLMAKGFMLPDKMDPDDYVKTHGADKLREEIGRAPELFTLLLLKLWMRDYNGSPSSKVRVIQDASLSLKDMQSRQLLDLYVLELSRQLDVEVGWVRKALTEAWRARTLVRPSGQAESQNSAEAIAEPTAPANEDEEETQLAVKAAPKNEAIVLSLLLQNESLMRDLIAAGPEDTLGLFTNEGVRRILAWVVKKLEKDPSCYAKLAASVASRVDDPSIVTRALQLMPSEPLEGYEQKLMADYLRAMQQGQLKNQSKLLISEMRALGSHGQLQAFQNLQRARLARDLGGSNVGSSSGGEGASRPRNGDASHEDTAPEENG